MATARPPSNLAIPSPPRPFPWALVVGVTLLLLTAFSVANTVALREQRRIWLRGQEQDGLGTQSERRGVDAEIERAKARQAALNVSLREAEAWLREKEKAQKAAEARRQRLKAEEAARAAVKARIEKEKKAKLDKCLQDPSDPLCGLN